MAAPSLNPLTGAKDMWRNASPTGAIGDFLQVFRQAGAARWPVALLAALTTCAVFSLIVTQSWRKAPAKPDIVWITTFAPDRTEAEIIASNLANQKRKDALAVEQARRDAEVRKIYETVGRASGIDVDRAAAQGAAERAAGEAKRKADQAEALKKVEQAELAGQR